MVSAPCLQFSFRRGGRSGYQGERVVPFEIGGRRVTPAERNEQVLSTPPTQQHGWLKGLLIQERKDVVAASRREDEPVHHATFWAARDWALRAGFSDVDVYRAAAAALTLRREHGAGNVTKAMVVDLVRAGMGDPHQDPGLIAAWGAVQRELVQAVDGPTYRLWLASVHPHVRNDGAWVVACRRNAVGWIGTRFGRVLEQAAGRPVAIVVCDGT
jgi:hypothetical protein